MIQLLLIALVQAASGDPAPVAAPEETPATAEQAASASPAAAPQAGSASDSSEHVTVQGQGTHNLPPAVHCSYVEVTGSHMGRQRVCTTSRQESDVQADLREAITSVSQDQQMRAARRSGK